MFYAAADRRDRNNARAKDALRSGEQLVTSDHVLVETWFLHAARGGQRSADRWWDLMRAGLARIEHVTLGDLDIAFAIGESFPDQGFSIVDRTSFAVMVRLGVHRAATLDHHFAVFRFGRDRSRAFEIVP